jgi:hypothetical protein
MKFNELWVWDDQWSEINGFLEPWSCFLNLFPVVFLGLCERDDEAHEEEERKKISCRECIIRSNWVVWSNGLLFDKKIKWLKLKNINGVYGGPTIILVQPNKLGLKFNGKDQID